MPKNPPNKGYCITAYTATGLVVDIHERHAHGRYPNRYSVRNMKKRAARITDVARVTRQRTWDSKRGCW